MTTDATDLRRSPLTVQGWQTLVLGIADLDAIERAAAAWRAAVADPLIASITPGAPFVVSAAVAERGKVEFDRIRQLFDVQNDHLTQAREAGIADLDRTRFWPSACRCSSTTCSPSPGSGGSIRRRPRSTSTPPWMRRWPT